MRVFEIALPGVGLAICAGMAWWGINVASDRALEAMWWPLNTPNVLMAGAAVGGALLVDQVNRRDRRRKLQSEREFSKVREEMQLTLSLPGTLPTLKPMPVLSGSRECHAFGSRNGIDCHVFNLAARYGDEEYYDGDGWSYTHFWITVILVPEVGLPTFWVHPRSSSFADRIVKWFRVWEVTLDPAAEPSRDTMIVNEFNSLYVVLVPKPPELPFFIVDEERKRRQEKVQPVSRLFTPAVIESFIRWSGWSVESHEGAVAFWKGEGYRPTSELPGFLEEAFALHSALVAAHGIPSPG